MTVCRLTIKVNKSISWYDKYVYIWTGVAPNEGKVVGEWPGVKLAFDGEEGDYYVYHHDLDASLNGQKINYIINNGGGGNGNQTKDLNVTLNGANTTVTVESSDLN